MSLKISITLMLVGLTITGVGAQVMLGGFIIIDFANNVKKYPPELKDEINSLVELRKQIESLLQKQSFELTHSEGFTWVGIGVAMFVAGIPLLLSGRKDISDFIRAKDFLNDDFHDLHNKLLTVIVNLESAINDLKSNQNIVTNLINKKGKPLELIVNYIVRLSFSLWDSSVDQFKHLPKDEQKKLRKLHDFILESNEYIAPRENSLVSEIEKILKMSSENIKQELTNKLLEIFEENLYNYQLIFKRMHNELNSISWIKNQNWEKNMRFPLDEKKMIIDKKGTFWYE